MGKLTDEGVRDFKEIWRRIRRGDFSGNIGLVIKNSIYLFSSNLIAKLGSFIFIIILARMLMPELFGLYSLSLSIILIFSGMADLGIGVTLLRFVSRELGRKNNEKAMAYIDYLARIKFILVFLYPFLPFQLQ